MNPQQIKKRRLSEIRRQIICGKGSYVSLEEFTALQCGQMVITNPGTIYRHHRPFKTQSIWYNLFRIENGNLIFVRRVTTGYVQAYQKMVEDYETMLGLAPPVWVAD